MKKPRKPPETCPNCTAKLKETKQWLECPSCGLIMMKQAQEAIIMDATGTSVKQVTS